MSSSIKALLVVHMFLSTDVIADLCFVFLDFPVPAHLLQHSTSLLSGVHMA